MIPDVFSPDLSSMWELWVHSVKSCVDFSMCMYYYAASVWLIPSVHPSAPVSSMDVPMEQEPGKLYFNWAHSLTLLVSFIFWGQFQEIYEDLCRLLN